MGSAGAPHRTGAFYLSALFIGFAFLLSEQPGFAFYWIDGYANVWLPSAFFMLGLAILLLAPGRQIAALALLILAALGHEMLTLYAILLLGYIFIFRFRDLKRKDFLAGAGAFIILALILAAQLFGPGPSRRRGIYAQRRAELYDWSALDAVLGAYGELQWLTLLAAPLFGAAIGQLLWRYKGAALTRRAADFQKNFLFWAILSATLIAYGVVIPAMISVSKPSFILSYYGVLKTIFLMLGGVLFAVAWRGRAHAPAAHEEGDPFSANIGRQRTFQALAAAMAFLVIAAPNGREAVAVAAHYPVLRSQTAQYYEGLSAGAAPSTAPIRVCRPNSELLLGLNMFSRLAGRFIDRADKDVRETMCPRSGRGAPRGP